VATPLGTFGVNEIAEALAYYSDSAFCLAIGLVIIAVAILRSILILDMNRIQKGEVNLVSLSEMIEGGKPWTEKIRLMSRLAVSTTVMFWRDWDEVGEFNEVIQHK